MGKRGKRPATASELKLTGSFREDRHSSRGENMGYAKGRPDAPNTLSPQAREVWEFVCNQVPLDLLSPTDRIALGGLCRWLQRWDALITRLENGSSDDEYKDQRAANASWAQVAAMLAKFGMTPGDRARMLPTGPADESKTENPILNIIKMREGKRKPG